MMVAIHQPNYMPWLGYFYKIARSNVFVFLDKVQIPRGRSYCYRSKIKTQSGSKWMSVPIARAGLDLLDVNICDVRIDSSKNWQERHLGMLHAAYSKSPYFREMFDIVQDILVRNWEKLAELNEMLIREIVGMLEITDVTFTRMSALEAKGHSTSLLIDICKKFGATHYLSGMGGAKYQDSEEFLENGISVIYSDFKHPQYEQRWGEFVKNLSILDLLFNCGRRETRRLLMQ